MKKISEIIYILNDIRSGFIDRGETYDAAAIGDAISYLSQIKNSDSDNEKDKNDFIEEALKISSVEKAEDKYILTVPYYDHHNDALTLGLSKDNSGEWTISDGGYILDEIEMSFEPDEQIKKRKIVEDLIEREGLWITESGEIVTIVDQEFLHHEIIDFTRTLLFVARKIFH